jgi:hypothetical protein
MGRGTKPSQPWIKDLSRKQRIPQRIDKKEVFFAKKWQKVSLNPQGF